MATLRLSVLQTVQVRLDGVRVACFRSAKTLALLIYLAVEHQRPHRRSVLAGLLWPDQPERVAQHNLSQALVNLRRALGDQTGTSTWFACTKQTLQFRPPEDADWLDLAAITAHLAACETHAHSDKALCATCVKHLSAAARLYQGTFLADFSLSGSNLFEEWALVKREQLHGQIVSGLIYAANFYEQQRDYRAAQQVSRRLVELEPLDERGHRQFMRLLALDGQRGQALAHFALCRKLIGAELGVEPTEETLALYEQLRNGTLETQASPQVGVAPPAPRLNAGVAFSEYDIPDPGTFYGRSDEVAALRQWIVAERARLVMVRGLGGVGKTTLAAYVAQVCSADFDRVSWHSLLSVPTPRETLRRCFSRLAPQGLVVPEQLSDQIDLLLHLLHETRCLLIFDNLESVCAGADQAGVYRAGYEDYGQMICQIGQRSHQSCLIVTSREQPADLGRLVWVQRAIRTLSLGGLTLASGLEVLGGHRLVGSEIDRISVVERYSGNPLALHLVANTVESLFDGNIDAFLRSGAQIFDDIRVVLDQQFARLSPLEQGLLLWLAIERQPCSVVMLERNFVQSVPKRRIIEALRSLQQHSLVEQREEGLVLQNVVQEYLTDTLAERTAQSTSWSRCGTCGHERVHAG